MREFPGSFSLIHPAISEELWSQDFCDYLTYIPTMGVYRLAFLVKIWFSQIEMKIVCTTDSQLKSIIFISGYQTK